MLTIKHAIAVILAMTTLLHAYGAEEPGSAPIGAGVKGISSLAQGSKGDDRIWPKADPKAVKAWQDMRFGMFIHWGPVTLTGQELSWSRGTKTPIEEYDQIYQRFNPTNFNADAWAQTASDAGMKYLIITTKHHDGFCLWPSKYTDHHIGNTPFKRDVLKELAAACPRHDVAFSTYYSAGDWYHRAALDVGAGDAKPNANHERYMVYMRNQLEELVTNYGPLLTMWFDGSDYIKKAQGFPVMLGLRALQPNILINNRLYSDGAPGGRELTLQRTVGDYSTPEQFIGDFERERPWESCITIGTQWSWKPNDQLKSVKQCLQMLLHTVGGDGNLLLNIGPMADGRIEPRQVEELKEMGAWLKMYGRGIYGTRGGPFKPGHWGVSTCKDNRIFIFVMQWPKKGALKLPPLPVKVRSSTLLSGGELKLDQSDEGISITVPKEGRRDIASVIELTVDGKALDIPPVDVKMAGAGFKPAVAQVTLDRSRVSAGDTVQATYTFHSSGPAAQDLQTFVHVVRPDGRHIGADFEPDLPTSEWPEGAFVREGPFPIAVPADAQPGKYEVWVGMFSSGGERVQFDNADRLRGDREYCVAEFEVMPPGIATVEEAAVFKWLPVVEAKVITAPLPPSATGLQELERIEISVSPKVLNPVLEPKVHGKLTLTGIYADGSRRVLKHSQAVLEARTMDASGGVQVVAIEGDRVVAREGGLATIEAAIRLPGKRLVAATEVVVRPFYREYHQNLVMKLFLGMEGEPVERLAKLNLPEFRTEDRVMCTLEQALEVIRKTDNLTRGIPKIIYLVGWQKGGHDHGYPAWDEVNPKLKRPQDATALDSLRWLIREGRKYNTTVSLHINMTDAYEQSPVWDEYLAKDCISKDENGKPYSRTSQIKGEPVYTVVYPNEWAAGLAQRRIDKLIAMIPELKEGHTIHVDVFIAQDEGAKPLSPWHAKPENGGYSPERLVETQRKIFHYWRERGFDVTGEGTGWAHPPGEHFVGLQPMSWWYSWNQMAIPECLGARGRTSRDGDGDFRFGSSMHGEEIWKEDKERMPRFLGMFCRTTLPWYFLSRHERVKFENEALYYSDGVVARTEDGKNIIRKGDFVLRENDNLFVPALWRMEKEIIAYSREGYENKSWLLPEDWRDIKGVDTYRVTMEGCVPMKKGVEAATGRLTLSLPPDEAVSIVPAGTRVAHR